MGTITSLVNQFNREIILTAMQDNKHLFALYTHVLHEISVGETLSLRDPIAWQRVVTVLRLQHKKYVTLFNHTHHVLLCLGQKTFTTSGTIVGTVVAHELNKVLTPPLDLVIGLTKKEAFENIVYSAAQLGVANIYPLISAKTHKNWFGEKDRERLDKIMIAACEQSKNFVLPHLHQPRSFSMLSQIICVVPSNTKIFFTPHGLPLMSVAHGDLPVKRLVVLVGPEGGFTESEEDAVRINGFVEHALTPTILRSQDAVLVGIGSLRCIMNRSI